MEAPSVWHRNPPALDADNGARRQWVRRLQPDRSQSIRHAMQASFLLLNLWIGIVFFRWVRSFEQVGSGMAQPATARPAGVDGWLPIAGLMHTKYLFLTGHLPAIHPAALFLFLAFVAISLLLKRAFCSWLCPVGTLSEAMWHLGQWIFGKSLRLPRWLDLPLRSLKYLLLGLFVLLIGSMSALALEQFMQTPYGLIVDVRMLNFFRFMSLTSAIVMVALGLLSLVIQNFWCRYLCPYGALLGLVATLSPVRIRRETSACIACGKCAHRCPSHLPVDKLVQIRSAECTACMECVAVCPAQDALQLALPARKTSRQMPQWSGRRLHPATVAAAIALLFLSAVVWAHQTHHWQTELPRTVYQQLIPEANVLSHPGL